MTWTRIHVTYLQRVSGALIGASMDAFRSGVIVMEAFYTVMKENSHLDFHISRFSFEKYYRFLFSYDMEFGRSLYIK